MPMPMIPVTGIGDDEKFTLIGRDPIKSTQGLSLSLIQTEIFKCEFDATRKGRMVQYDYNFIIMVQGL